MEPPSDLNHILKEREETTLKFIWKLKSAQVAKAILDKRHKTAGIAKPDFNLHYQLAKRAQHRHRDINTDQRNRIKDMEIHLQR